MNDVLRKRWPVVVGLALTVSGLLDVGGCAEQSAPEDALIGSLTTGATTATLTLQSDWTSGYCANVAVTNGGATAITGWQVVINLNQSTTSQVWGASTTISGATVTAGPLSWSAAIAPGASTTFGFCGAGTGANYRPELVSIRDTSNPGSGGGVGTGGNGSGGRVGSTSTGGTSASGGTTGSRGTGGISGTGGATASGSQCTLPWPANNGTGSFTNYSFGQGSYRDDLGYRTACGYIGVEPNGQSSDSIANIANPSYFAAVPGVNNFNTVDHCGACAQITNGSKSIVVTIVDECPYDGGQNQPCGANPTGHLDLSYAAWAALGYTTGDPKGTVWKYVPCPISGGVVLRIHGDPSWGQVYVENEILPIVSVRTSSGAPGTHTQSGFWQLPGALAAGQTLTLTDTSGRVVNASIASTDPAANASSGTQFPMCM